MDAYKPKNMNEAANGLLDYMDPSRDNPVSPADYLAQLQIDSLRNQQAAAQTTAKQLAELQNKPKQVDLTPYAMAVDALTGSKMAQQYQAFKPKNQDQQKLLLSQLYGKQNQGITDDLINMQNQAYKQDQLSMMERLAQMKQAQGFKDNPFQKKKLEALGKQAGEYLSKDRPNLAANLPKVEKTLGILEDNPGLTGNWTQQLFGSTGATLYSPDLKIAEESMQSAIQDTLRPTLGAQFTEKEGERIMNLAFNPGLPTEENKRRAKELQKVINNKIKFQDDLYNWIADKGTDEGFPFEQYGMQKAGGAAASSATSMSRIEELRRKRAGK